MITDIIDSLMKTMKSLLDLAPIKAILATVVAFTGSSHYPVITAFVALITIDLLTKWMALSYKHLVDHGVCSDNVGLFQCLLDVPGALHDGYISSGPMKTRFVGKIFLYMILVYAAMKVDTMAGGGGVFLQGSWYYLAATEAISIVENLRDAGVQSLDPLLTFIRSKLGGLK